MYGYFKPLRRKLGVVTLILACVFAAGYIRFRYYYEDWGFVRVGQTYYLLQSHHGGFSYHKWPKPPPNQWFGSRSVQTIAILGIGTGPRNHFFIDYFTSTILLTPLSAYLLLSKPWARKSQKSTELVDRETREAREVEGG